MFVREGIDSLLEENEHREREGNDGCVHHPWVDGNSKDGGLRERERERERKRGREGEREIQ